MLSLVGFLRFTLITLRALSMERSQGALDKYSCCDKATDFVLIRSGNSPYELRRLCDDSSHYDQEAEILQLGCTGDITEEDLEKLERLTVSINETHAGLFDGGGLAQG